MDSSQSHDPSGMFVCMEQQSCDGQWMWMDVCMYQRSIMSYSMNGYVRLYVWKNNHVIFCECVCIWVCINVCFNKGLNGSVWMFMYEGMYPIAIMSSSGNLYVYMYVSSLHCMYRCELILIHSQKTSTIHIDTYILYILIHTFIPCLRSYIPIHLSIVPIHTLIHTHSLYEWEGGK